jgi:hypothetical protein
MSALPSLGRVVHYTLCESDVEMINSRRGEDPNSGNRVQVGDVFPALVVRVWSETCVNLQVHLDGRDLLWATLRTEGDGPTYWHWPPRV